MPIYEFRCSACGHIQELIVSGTSDELKMQCEECQGESLERVLSRVSYVMGGSSGAASSADSGSVTTKSCGPGQSCSTIELPGYTRS